MARINEVTTFGNSEKMASRCSVFVATSLDGYIARKNGSIDWLEQANASVPRGEDCGFAEYLASIDALVMGRATFDLACTFSNWPYGETPVYVLSHSMTQLPSGTPQTVKLLCAEPAEVVRIAATNQHHRLYVDGGSTIQAFLEVGLIAELTITVIPVLLGSGIRLFGELPSDVSLKLRSNRSYPFGFVQSRYEIAQSS
jgi:dihydrofolate reductase